MSQAERFQIEPTAPHPGMGTGKKILLGCGIGCGVICLLCCGTGGFVLWRISKSVTKDPADIRRMSAEIATIELPAWLEPKAGVDLKIPFAAQAMVKMAVYGDAEDSGTNVLTLCEIDVPVQEADKDQLQKQIDEAMSRAGQQSKNDEFRLQESHEIETTIRGETVTFHIEEGDTRDGKKLIRTVGQFPGRQGIVVLFSLLDAEKIDVEQVEKILRSIK